MSNANETYKRHETKCFLLDYLAYIIVGVYIGLLESLSFSYAGV